MKRVLPIVLSLFFATTLFAQEFGRASAGAIDMTPRSSSQFSGSFSLSSARSLGATFGGTVVKDHVWFFASADRQEPLFRTTMTPSSTIDLSGALARTAPVAPALTLPKDFLSLHSTMIVSPSSFFTIDVHSMR